MLNIQHQLTNDDLISSSISGSSSCSSSVEPEPAKNNQSTHLKSYLLEKLLSEQPIKSPASTTKKTASREDLVSETGTYTVEEKHSDSKLENEKFGDNIFSSSIDLMSARAAIDEKFGIVNESINDGPESELTTTEIINPELMEPDLMNHKRQMQKNSRERNKTYSLTHDLVVHLNQQLVDKNNHDLMSAANNGVGNSLTKTQTYDVIANNEELICGSGLSLGDSVDLDNTVVSSQVSSTKSGVDTELLLGNTEQLIETIKKRRSDKKLLLQKRLDTANNCIKNSSKHTLSPSSSSECSSSTTMSMDLNTKNDLRSWTIPATSNNSANQEEENCLQTTRATVNASNSFHSKNSNSSYSEEENKLSSESNTHRGGLTFDYNLSDEKNGSIIKPRPKQPERLSSANLQRHRSNSRQTTSTSTSSKSKPSSVTNNTDFTNTNTNTTAKSGISLGARIASKATTTNYNSNLENNNSTPRTGVRRRASDSVQPSTGISNSVSSSVTSRSNQSGNSIASPYVNRTTFLRQQSALAKRESLSNSSESSRKQQQQVPLNGILKKATTTTSSNYGNRSVQRASSKQPSRTSSRNSSPHNNNSNNVHVPSHQSALMTGSLNLPYGASLSSTHNNTFNNDQRGSFQRRKNYDPIKAVELEKQNKLLAKNRPQMASPYKQQVPMTNGNNHGLEPSASQGSMYSTDNERHYNDYDSMSSDQSSFSIPIQSLKANVGNKQSYEKILQSTLQRLCIRLIQMSTGVLDKIGDENSETNVLNSVDSTELERMQQLAKLVHSMQLVHDHIQIIDTSLFNQRPNEDAYMKELSKIRQEVEYLKQNVSANTSVASNISN